MPTYDYACAACGHRFEVIHGVHASGPEACPACGQAPVRKVVVAPAFMFKGSGWAKMDRRAGPASTKASETSDDAAPKKAAPDSKADGGATTPTTDTGSSAPATPTTGGTD